MHGFYETALPGAMQPGRYAFWPDCPERRAIAAPCRVGAATRRRRPLVLLPLLLLVLLVECTIRPV